MNLSIKSALALGLLIAPVFAQPIASPPPTFIKGNMAIKFDARRSDAAGTTNKYQLTINVNDSAHFNGTIEHLPFKKNTFGSNQKAQLTFAIDAAVVNPRNISETRAVGKISGSVPIDERNVYNWGAGTAVLNVFGSGTAPGFTSKFAGLAAGKPPATGIVDKALDKLTLSNSKGKIVVTKYDRMEFQSHQLAAGPIAVYPEVTVSGPLFYDYDRDAWYFQNVAVAYVEQGRRMQDTLTGNVRWVPASNYKTSGIGEYQFDIRVNEPPVNEAAAFAGPADEAAFFATDAKIPSLTGTMKYKDTVLNGVVISSAIEINLVGTAITKQQVMYLCKLFILSSVVPVNDQ